MIEVGLVLPIFILILVSVLEFGWYAAVSAATTTASREAARYGSTIGNPAAPNYVDCQGIRNAARRISSPLINLNDSDIVVFYDDGTLNPAGEPNPTAQACVSTASRPSPGDLDQFDRVVVRVTVEYEPLVPLLRPFIGTATFVSEDRRSIAKPPPS